MTLFGCSQDVCVCDAAALKLSLEGEHFFFNTILPLEINSDGGGEENP